MGIIFLHEYPYPTRGVLPPATEVEVEVTSQMVKYKLMVAVLLVLAALPTLALANWNASSMSSCSSCKSLSCEMNSCRTVVPTPIVSIAQQRPLCSVCVPMEPATIAGRAILSPCAANTTCAPADMRMYSTMVPVSVQTINNCPTLCAPMDNHLANRVVLVPTAFGTEQMMLPTLMKPMGNGMMMFSPLDTNIAGANGSAAIALQLNGRTCMAPLNWQSCVNNSSLCLPTSDVIQMRAQTDIDKD